MTPKQQLNGEKWDGELILLPGEDAPSVYMHALMLYVASTVSAGTHSFSDFMDGSETLRVWDWEILLKELTFTGLAILFFIFIFNYIFSWIFILVMICLLHFCCCCESAGWFYQRIINHYALKIGWDKTQRQHLSLQTYIFSRTLQYIMKSSLHRDESHP